MGKEEFDYTSPDRPLSIVCIDGSKESDRAFLWAMKTLPRNHGLMLVHGVKVHKASIHIQKVQNLREHRQMAERYEIQCQQNGRACGMVHFHYQWGDELGEDVCSYARLRGAEGVITGRRANVSNTRRALFGSLAPYVLGHCPDVWVTVVPSKT